MFGWRWVGGFWPSGCSFCKSEKICTPLNVTKTFQPYIFSFRLCSFEGMGQLPTEHCSFGKNRTTPQLCTLLLLLHHSGMYMVASHKPALHSATFHTCTTFLFYIGHAKRVAASIYPRSGEGGIIYSSRLAGQGHTGIQCGVPGPAGVYVLQLVLKSIGRGSYGTNDNFFYQIRGGTVQVKQVKQNQKIFHIY